MKDLSNNAKAAAGVVATATVSTGLATFLEAIPSDIGKLASLLGATLTVVLILVHTIKGRAEIKKAHLELDVIEEIRNEIRESVRQSDMCSNCDRGKDEHS